MHGSRIRRITASLLAALFLVVVPLARASNQTSTFALTLSSTSPPSIKLSASTLTFASQPATTGSAPQILTITNSGGSAVTLSAIAVSGAESDDFKSSTNCTASLLPTATCSVSVVFEPVSAGAKAAVLELSVDATLSIQVGLKGTGTPAPPVTLSSGALNFAAQPAGSYSPPQTVVVTDSGAQYATLNSIQVTGAEADDFALSTSCGFFLAPGTNCSISVTFKPVSAGAKTAILAIVVDGLSSPQQIRLSGEASKALPPLFQIASQTLKVTVAPTDAAPVPAIGLTVTSPPAGGIYSTYTVTGPAVIGADVVWSANPIQGVLSGSLELTFDTPALQGSGTYTSTVVVKACLDSLCKKQVAGSPQTVQVTYVVTGNAIPAGEFGLSPTSLNVETPSNAQTPPATISLVAYELPPYGAYVTYKTKTTSVVQSMSFQGFVTGKSYGNGMLTVNFTPPSTLGPGVYQDIITLSVCYDQACTKPAVGSPWLIPVTYTVTASEGREFQQRIVALSANALAVDPQGKRLYVADYEFSGASQSNLVQVDPASGALLASVPLPGDPIPNELTISSDGKYAYVAVLIESQDTAEVDRVDLATMTVDLRIPFSEFGVSIDQLTVSPLDSNTIALSYGYIPRTPGGPFSDIQIMDGGVARPNMYSITEESYGSVHQWSTDGSRLFILDSSQISSAPVDASGIGSPSLIVPVVYGDGLNGYFHNLNDVLYSIYGGVLDPKTKAILGHFNLSTPSSTSTNPAPSFGLLPDASTGQAFVTYEDSGAASVLYTLESFDLHKFTPVWIARFPVQITSPVRWGTNGLAFIGLNADTTNGQFSVYLIDGTFVAH